MNSRERQSAALVNLAASAVLGAVSLALVLDAAFSDAIAQDWIPFRVAASLAARSQWSDIYPTAAAADLFDVSPSFRAVANDHVTRSGALAVTGNPLTAFVAPPPAAFLLAPLITVSWPTALVVSRLALALPLVTAMIAFAVAGCRDPAERMRWSLLCLLSFPLLSYTVGIGQPSAWLFVAAVASIVTMRWLDVLGGVALGLAILTKATPLVLAFGLIAIGRRRLGGYALALAAAAIALTASQSGWEGWRHFLAIADRAGRSVITDWNNTSIDADVLRWVTGRAVTSFSSPGVGVRAAVVAIKLIALSGVIWSAWRRGGLRHRISALWIAWLVASPMLWLHYLVTLVPLAGIAPRQRFPLATLCVAVLSVSLLIRAAGVNPVVVGHIVTFVWVATAISLTWPTIHEREPEAAPSGERHAS